MEFLSFVRALNLEPVNDSVIAKLIDTVKFQGYRINTVELGSELTESLTRLLKSEHMEFQEAEEMDESNGDEVVLYDSLKLPEINTSHYLTRRLEHNVVLLTKSGSSWKALELELLRRMQTEKENGDSDSDDRTGNLGEGEIFAISWAESSNGCGRAFESVEENTTSEYEQSKVETESEEECCETELLKASDLLKWRNSRQHEIYSQDDNQSMEMNKTGENDGKNMDMQTFVNRWVKPPPGKLRLIELDEVENPDVQFNSLCSVSDCLTVHWLQGFRNGGFIWRKTRGQLKISRLNLSAISYQEGNWLSYLEHKAWQSVICISGVAGMGKTTFLANMAHVLKKKYKNRLVCFIHLNKLSELIDKMNVNMLDILTFSELMLQYFTPETDIEKSIFKCLLTTVHVNRMEPKIEFMMDGIDSMSETGRNLLLNFLVDELKFCDKWSFRVWLTTRSHLKYEIENALSIVAYDLDAIDSTDMVQYFMMCNTYINSQHTNLVYNAVNDLFSSSLKAYLKIDLRAMLGEPEKMTAFEAFMKNNNYPDPFTLNATLIMREVIMKNVRSYYIKKYHGDTEEDGQNAADEILSKHLPLAIQVCSGNCKGPTDGIDLNEELTLQEETELLEFGMLTKNKDGKLAFVHGAYPSYILADYYLKSIPDNGVTSNFFFEYVLTRDSCDLTRQFYEESLEKGLNLTVSSEWMLLIRSFLIKSYFLSDDMFDHDQVHSNTNVLQLAIIDQRPKLAKLILRSFVPDHRKECQRLIRRKVKVQINDVRKHMKNSMLVNSNSMINSQIKCRKRDYNGRIITKNGNSNSQTNHYIELSSLSLAILLGDAELVHSMYIILGDEGNPSHMEQFSDIDSFHFLPLHLAVIGCNKETLKYLTREKKLSCNNMDACGHLPIHLLFFNRWVLKFPSIGLVNLEIEPLVLREVHICKYYENKLDPEWDDRVGEVPDRAGHLPLLSSCFMMGYIKMQMKKSLNFAHKRTSQPWKICYYRSYESYVAIAESLSGRTLINFSKKVEGMIGRIPPPFHLACASGFLPIIKAMIEKKVNINIRDSKDRTALYSALCKEQMHVVQFLLENKIDPDISHDINGVNLLHHLAVQNFAKAISYVVQELHVPVDLRLERFDNCTPLHMGCMAGSLDAAETLIELGADVNARDEEHYTPLLHAVHPTGPCNLNLVKLLIEKGADMNAVCDKDEEGRTCLHQAVLTKNLPLLKLLLKYGKDKIDVNATTKKGQSALHLACMQRESKDMLELLVKAGATVNLEDNLGQTPLFVFCVENYTDTAMAMYLIKQGATIFHIVSGQSLLRELNKRNAVLGELVYGAWKTIKENQEKLEKSKKLKRKLLELNTFSI